MAHKKIKGITPLSQGTNARMAVVVVLFQKAIVCTQIVQIVLVCVCVCVFDATNAEARVGIYCARQSVPSGAHKSW